MVSSLKEKIAVEIKRSKRKQSLEEKEAPATF